MTVILRVMQLTKLLETDRALPVKWVYNKINANKRKNGTALATQYRFLRQSLLRSERPMDNLTTSPRVFTIPLTKGYSTVISAEDIDLVSLKWCASISTNGLPYAMRGASANGKNTRQILHRVILERIIGRQVAKSEVVDHINGDTLDNTRANLRLASRSQNMANSQLAANNSSGAKGVCWDKTHNSWQAQIVVNGKRIRLGRFKAKNDAIRAYNVAAFTHHGEFAVLNMIEEGE